jgi:toxin CcdB
MTQFVACENLNRTTKKTYPYLLDIQSNLLDELRTTIVIPLCPAKQMENLAITRLCPVMQINNDNYIALTQQMSGINRKALGKEVCDLSHYRSEISAALDFIVSGI